MALGFAEVMEVDASDQVQIIERSAQSCKKLNGG
jgi:hypothetical protein